MEKFCGRDMTEPPSQGKHSPAVPAYILRRNTSFALLPSFSSPVTQMAGSQSPSEAKKMPVPGFEPRIFSLRVKRCLEGVRGGRIWIEQTYTPKPNGLVLRPENEPFSSLPHFFLLVISCFLQALSRDDAPQGTCPLTSHTHGSPYSRV